MQVEEGKDQYVYSTEVQGQGCTYTPYTPLGTSKEGTEMGRQDEYVSMIPGNGWVAVFTDSAIRPVPLVAWVMRRDGSIEAVGPDLENPADKEFFSHYARASSDYGRG